MTSPRDQEPFPTTEGLGSLMDETCADPWEWFESVRARGPVVWDDGADAWLATTYDANRELALNNITVFAKPQQLSGESEFGRYYDAPPEGVDPEQWRAMVERFKISQHEGHRSTELAMLEGRVHFHQHRWWVNTYSPRVLEGWRQAYISPLTNAQIDRFVERGKAELVEDLLENVVPRVIAAVVGLPDDPEWVARYAALAKRRIGIRLAALEKSVTLEFLEDAAAAQEEMHAMLEPIVQARRSGNGNDIISIVWREADEFFRPDEWGPYDDDDVINLIHSLTRTGQSTVAASSRNPIYALMTHERDRQNLLRSGNDDMLAVFVDESLRLYGSVDVRPTVARHDTTLAGVAIKEGQTVLPLRMAANRDGSHFGCPAQIDLERSRPRDHFSFNKGPRSCPGQGLARMIMQEITRVVLERLHDLRLDPDAPPPRYSGNVVMRQWEPLHALFTPAPAKGA